MKLQNLVSPILKALIVVIYKPGSVDSKIYPAIICLGPALPQASGGLPESSDETSCFVPVYPQVFRFFRFLSYLALLRVEIAAFHLRSFIPLLVSVALILALRRTGITRYTAIWSPDFPPSAAKAAKSNCPISAMSKFISTS